MYIFRFASRRDCKSLGLLPVVSAEGVMQVPSVRMTLIAQKQWLLQDYCKDWAEQLIVSVVLVCSESKAPEMLRGNIVMTRHLLYRDMVFTVML